MRRWWVMVGVVLALVAGACGDDDDAGSPSGDAGADNAEVVAASATRTAEAKSARAEMDISVGEGTQQQTLHATGKFDFERGFGQLKMAASALIGDAAPGGDQAPIELLVTPGVLYMNFPLLTTFVPGTKPWVKIDLQALAQDSGLPINLAQLGQTDPTQAMQYLRGVGDAATKVGEEQLRDTTATHYKVDLDLGEAIEEAKKHLSEEQQKAFAADIDGVLPADVWIDDEGRLRKMTFNLADAPGSTETTTGLFAMELFDFGVPITDLAVPPADQITDFREVMRSGSPSTTTP
jgi:hypothetical protein